MCNDVTASATGDVLTSVKHRLSEIVFNSSEIRPMLGKAKRWASPILGQSKVGPNCAVDGILTHFRLAVSDVWVMRRWKL